MRHLHADDGLGGIEQETGVKPAWAAEAFTDLDADVRQSIGRIRADTSIRSRFRSAGSIYDVTNGSLREVRRRFPGGDLGHRRKRFARGGVGLIGHRRSLASSIELDRRGVPVSNPVNERR